MKPSPLFVAFAAACVSLSAQAALQEEVPEPDKPTPAAAPTSPAGAQTAPFATAGASPAADSPKPLVLTGGVEHSVTLPPVPPQLQPGQMFNASAAQQSFQSSDLWVRIPPWMAGTWHTEVEYALDTGKPVGYVTRVTRTFGAQVDRFGSVWEYKHFPWSETVDNGGSLDNKLVVFEKCLGQDPNRYFDKAITVDVIYDRATGRILTTYQQEELQWTYPQPDRTLKVDESIKRFDANGRPGVTRTGYFIRQPVGPFTVRQDLFNSFVNYLMANNLANAVPNGVPGAGP